MAQAQRYSHPPLVEALLDIQVELPTGFAVETLQQCHEPVKADYPAVRPMQQGVGRFEIGEQVTATASTQPHGFQFVSVDGLQLFQARRDGFTHNRLAPYLGWDLFRTEARRLWTVYREVAKPAAVRRVAVRYINRLDIPNSPSGVELKDYFRTSPEVSPDLPQRMAGFFMQVMLPVPDAKAMVTFTETIAPPAGPETTSVIFDLDLFRTEDVPTGEDDLWALFEVFREKKDDMFEACITDKTRELIK